MLKASWKSLLARKLRLVMSAFAIILGVAFVAGSFIFTDTLSRTFDRIFEDTSAEVTVSPRNEVDAGVEVSAGPVSRMQRPRTSSVTAAMS